MTFNFVLRGEGTPVVLIHGNPLDHRSMLPFDPWFEAAGGGWARYYLDLPGFGASSAGADIDGTVAVATATAEWIRAQVGSARFALVGHSFGGLIARELAGRFGDQVTGVALIAPVAVPDHAKRHVPAHQVAAAGGEWMDGLPAEARAAFEQVSVIHTPAAWEAYCDYFVPGLEAFDKRVVARIDANYALDSEPEQHYGPVAAPSLIALGRLDPIVGYRDQLQFAPFYPAATVVVLDGVGHMPHIEAPELTGALFVDWLHRVTRSLA